MPGAAGLKRAAHTLILAGTLPVAGCVAYEPAPVSIGAAAAVHESATIDHDAIAAELARIAPGYTWRDDEWNSLTLLAAALTTSPEIARARAGVAAAEAEAAGARVAPGPALTVTAEYAFNPTEASNWLYGIASDLLRDRGGRRQGRIETADVAVRSAEFDYAAAVWSVRMAIRRALDARAAQTAAADIAADLVAMRQRQFDAVSARVEAGAVSRLELDRSRADLAQSSRVAVEAEAAAHRATLDVAAALGVPQNALALGPVPALPDPAGPEAPAFTATDRADALELRTEILQATAAYDRAEAALRIAVASQYPQVSLGPGYTWERGLSKLPFNLGLALPSRDRGRSAIAAAEARRAEAGRQLEAAVATVEADITRAEADYEAALAVLDLIRTETLPTAAALAGQAEREFEAGAINRADWAAAQSGLLTARLDEVSAVRGVLDTEAALEDMLRRPLRGPESQIVTAAYAPPEDDVR